MIKKTYKISGMDCPSCALLVEGELEDAGVKAKCSYAKQSLEVEFDPQKTSEEKIKAAVKTAGYDLES